VVGYPTGGDTISVTQGVVSRIDCKNYRLGYTHQHSPGRILVIQIDAAINPGNSGGPAFSSDGCVVGVAFQGMGAHADGIGYLIPALVCRNFLSSLTSAEGSGLRYPGVTDVPFKLCELRNPSLRRKHRVPAERTGVLVTAVSPLAGLPLQEDDVIVAIDGKPLGDDGTVELRRLELMSADFLITCKPPGGATTFSVLRSGAPLEVSAVLRPLAHTLPRCHGFDCTPEYIIIGGLVFSRLACPMLENKQHKSHSQALYDLINFKLVSTFCVDPDAEILVLTEILTDSLNYGYTAGSWRVLSTLNGVPVTSLRQLHSLYRTWDGEYFEFCFSHDMGHGGSKIVLDATQCRAIEPAILSTHAIPSAVSKGLEECETLIPADGAGGGAGGAVNGGGAAGKGNGVAGGEHAVAAPLRNGSV